MDTQRIAFLKRLDRIREKIKYTKELEEDIKPRPTLSMQMIGDANPANSIHWTTQNGKKIPFGVDEREDIHILDHGEYSYSFTPTNRQLYRRNKETGEVQLIQDLPNKKEE